MRMRRESLDRPHPRPLSRKQGIRYIAYYWAQREPAAEARAHPEWRSVNSKGKPTGYFCVNQPAYRELVRNRVVELVAKVGVDGVFFDMFHARSDDCYCPACKARFRKLTGQEPPVKEDLDSLLWQQWVEFKYRSIEEAMLEFNRAIKAANPQAALVVNTWNAWVYRDPRTMPGPHNTRNSIRVAEVADALLEETGWYDSVDPSFFAFPTLHNFMSWHLGGLCKHKRALMWSGPSFLGAYPIAYPEAVVRARWRRTGGHLRDLGLRRARAGPADVTWACFRYGRTDLGRILELALRQAAAAPPPVEVIAPTIVQAMTHVQGQRLVVHLLNDISSLGRSQNVAGERKSAPCGT